MPVSFDALERLSRVKQTACHFVAVWTHKHTTKKSEQLTTPYKGRIVACNLLGEKHMTQGTLLAKTIELLKADKRTLRMVGQATGIPYYWLKKLSAGEIDDPSVNRIQQLYEFLSKKKILA